MAQPPPSARSLPGSVPFRQPSLIPRPLSLFRVPFLGGAAGATIVARRRWRHEPPAPGRTSHRPSRSGAGRARLRSVKSRHCVRLERSSPGVVFFVNADRPPRDRSRGRRAYRACFPLPGPAEALCPRLDSRPSAFTAALKPSTAGYSNATTTTRARRTTTPMAFRAGETFFFDKPVFSVAVDPGSDMAIPLRWLKGSDEACARRQLVCRRPSG